MKELDEIIESNSDKQFLKLTEENELKRQKWVIKGIQIEKLAPKVLNEVYLNYVTIDMVPTHYFHHKLMESDSKQAKELSKADVQPII